MRALVATGAAGLPLHQVSPSPPRAVARSQAICSQDSPLGPGKQMGRDTALVACSWSHSFTVLGKAPQVGPTPSLCPQGPFVLLPFDMHPLLRSVIWEESDGESDSKQECSLPAVPLPRQRPHPLSRLHLDVIRPYGIASKRCSVPSTGPLEMPKPPHSHLQWRQRRQQQSLQSTHAPGQLASQRVLQSSSDISTVESIHNL